LTLVEVGRSDQATLDLIRAAENQKGLEDARRRHSG
jgi:hypothetical protein